MNDADSRHLASRLESMDITPADRPEEADIIVLNTCVVRQQAEDKIYSKLQNIQHLKKKRPERIIALMGCIVGRGQNGPLRERFPFVDVFMPPSDMAPLIDMLRHTLVSEITESNVLDDYYIPSESRNTITAHVPAVLGCSHACTYCIIPYRRGPERSRPVEEVMDEVKVLADQNIKEVVLLGQIVDRYGLDLEPATTLSRLLREVDRLKRFERIRFLTSHPGFITDELLETVRASSAICPHFELPFQAGNNAVLKRMRRGYTAEEYEETVARIRRYMPDAAIHTDVIVGFPGETDEQFLDSYRLLESVRVDKAHIARYSERPQTYAARRYEDTVSEEEKEERRKKLEALQIHIQEEKNRALLRTTVQVLVDGRDEKKNRWRGRTPQHRLVFFSSNRPDLMGQMVPVQIDWTGPFCLIGNDHGDV